MASMYTPEIQNFDDRALRAQKARKLAETLRGQANGVAAPEGGMVGTGPGARWVNPHWTSQLAPGIAQGIASYYGSKADTEEQGLVHDKSEAAMREQQRQQEHAAQWRSSLPQAVAAKEQQTAPYMAPGMDGEENIPGTSTITQQAQAAQPLTSNQVFEHYQAGATNPMLHDEAKAYSAMGLGEVTREDQQQQALLLAREKQQQDLLLAREKQAAAVQAAKDKTADKVAADERHGQLMKALVAMRIGGGGGGIGSGPSVVVGTDEAGNEVRMSTKTRDLFKVDNATGEVVPHAGPLTAKVSGKPPTEDQAKAAGWYKQANKAFTDIEAAMKADPESAKPTLRELAAGRIPIFSQEAQTATRTAARQRFVQASEAFSEATLRAATGAGVNKEEAAQKIRELTPVYGESPGLTAQKKASMIMYLDALNVRAGRALEQKPPGQPPGLGGGPAPKREDPLGLFNK